MGGMSASRLAAWIFGLAIGSAWLASAAGVGRTPPAPRVAPAPAVNAELAVLAADVQTQATRLKARLAQAPAPSAEHRNPFTFAAPRRAASRPAARQAPMPIPDPLPAGPTEATLVLIGIAEMPGDTGAVRTAMITRDGELLMVTAGQTLDGRYQVATIGTDAVALKDTTSGAVRTLVLR